MEQEPSIKRPSTFPLFSKYFSTHPQDAVIFFQEMQQQMYDYVQAFRRRIQVEVTYSKNLQQVSRALDKYIRPGTELSTSFICSAFKVQHEQRSRQSLELAQSIKTQIQAICSDYLRNQTVALRKMEKEVKRFYKDAQNYSQSHINAYEKYQSISRQLEQTIISKNIMKYTPGTSQQKKSKIQNKISQNIKQNKQSQKLYIKSVRQYNTFITSYNSQILPYLDQSQNLIREQVTLQGDCLRKLIVAEVSMFKNIQYDLINICKQMEVLDTQRNVQIFVEENKESQDNQIIREEKKEKRQEQRKSTPLEIFNIFPLQQKRVVAKSQLSQSIFYVEEGYFSWMLSSKNNLKLKDIISKIWKDIKSQIENTPENQQIQQSDHELRYFFSDFKILNPPNSVHLNEKIESQLNKKKILLTLKQIASIISFLWDSEQIDPQTLSNKINWLQTYLQLHFIYRLFALSFIQEYRLQNQFLLKSVNNARTCGKVIKVILSVSEKKSDVFIMRGLLALIFTFYWLEEKAKKSMNMILQIYQSQIWKKVDFWQAAIFQTCFEQMVAFTVKKGQNQVETTLRQKNIIFNHLASYCNFMVMLGVPSKNVKLTVGRFCRDLTEEQNKELLKMISNSEKQYKEIAPLLSSKNKKIRSKID